MNASPETLATLTATRDLYFSCLIWSSVAVVIGVALEGPEVMHETRKALGRIHAEPRRWITLLALVGWLLVVLGVAGEGVSEALVSNADGKIEAFNSTRLGAVSKVADNALDREEKLAAASQTLQAQLETSATRLSNSAEEIGWGRNAFWALQYHRSVFEPENVAKELSQYAGTEYDFPAIEQDAESVDLAEQISDVLAKAKWVLKPYEEKNVGVLGPSGSMILHGTRVTVAVMATNWDAGVVIVGPYRNSDARPPKLWDITQALVDSLDRSIVRMEWHDLAPPVLHDPGLMEVAGRGDPSVTRIHIVVAKKPPLKIPRYIHAPIPPSSPPPKR